MQIFSGRHIYWSPQNGFIFFNKKTGEIYVRGIKQTSERYPQLWANALHECPHASGSKEILLLGLGGGGILPALQRDYSAARITAIEHDAVMIQLTKERQGQEPLPKIILGDARAELSLLAKKFDLILVDLFLGGNPPAFIKERMFWDSVKNVLMPAGVVLLNVAGSQGYEEGARSRFVNSKAWMTFQNRFVALWSEAPRTNT